VEKFGRVTLGLNLQFLEEAFESFLDGFAIDLGEFLQDFFLPFVGSPGSFDDKLDDLVAAPVSADMRYSRTVDAYHFTGLGSGFYGNDFGLFIEQGDFDIRP